MQILLKNIKYILLSILLVFCLLATGCSKQLYQYSASIEAQHYPVLKYKLIELIDILPKPMPTTMKQTQALFNNQLYLKNKNDYFSFYEGGPFITQDGVIVTSVDIAARNNSTIPVESIGISLNQKQCVSTSLLKKKYNFHILSLYGPHPPDHPPISYDVGVSWGGFRVATTLDNEDCATGIGIFSH